MGGEDGADDRGGRFASLMEGLQTSVGLVRRDAEKQTAGGLGIKEEVEASFVEIGGAIEERRVIAAIVFEAAGDDGLTGEVESASKDGDRFEIEVDGNTRAFGDLGKMPEKPEARDIGTSRSMETQHDLRGEAIEAHHRRRDFGQIRRDELFALEGGGQDPCSERLGEEQAVADASGTIADDRLGVCDGGDSHPVLEFGIFDGMTAEDRDPGFTGLVCAASQDLCKDRDREGRCGKTDDVKRRERSRPHRVDIAQGIGDGDRPVLVRIIDDRCKKIDRLNKGDPFAQKKDTCIVVGFDADEKTGIRGRRELGQDTLEVART